MRKFIYVVLLGSIWTIAGAYGQTASVPDPAFLSFLKKNYSSVINSSNQLIISQAASLTGSFDCSGQNIQNLEGLQYFTGINNLDASSNAITSPAQVASLTALKILHLENNQIVALPSLASLQSLQMLIVHTNQLTSLPDLSANTQLTQIVAYNNLLTALPDLSKLSALTKIDVGNNRLSVTPDFRSNKQLTTLSIDRNALTTAPDLSGLPNLSTVQVHSNYFTFEDLIPYTSYPGFASVFTVQPQKNIPEPDLVIALNNTLILSTGADRNVSNVTYSWFFHNQSLGATGNDSLILNSIQSAQEGYYYCILTHPSIPSLQIRTDSFYVKVIGPCPKASDFSLETDKITCIKAGRLKVNATANPGTAYSFLLKSPVTGATLTSQTGSFDGLTEPSYQLTIQSPGFCVLTFPDVQIPGEPCNETFITPNGDGDKDSYFFEQSGHVVIYDKGGNKVKTLSIPNEWDGSSRLDKLVPAGYYVADVNQGETFIRISVIY